MKLGTQPGIGVVVRLAVAVIVGLLVGATVFVWVGVLLGPPVAVGVLVEVVVPVGVMVDVCGQRWVKVTVQGVADGVRVWVGVKVMVGVSVSTGVEVLVSVTVLVTVGVRVLLTTLRPDPMMLPGPVIEFVKSPIFPFANGLVTRMYCVPAVRVVTISERRSGGELKTLRSSLAT